VCRFLVGRGYRIPSSAAFGQIGERFAAELMRWAKANGIPVRHFAKGENKEAIARPLIEAAATEGGEGRVVLLGIAQEKASVWRSWVRKETERHAHPHMDWGRQMAFINHFYLYLWDPEWGPAFWKTNAYAPYPVWLWLNGHEWAKRQLTNAGIDYVALDNGLRSCADPVALQRICDALGPGVVWRFFARWQARLPSPFTPADRAAGYGYELAFRQFEVSDTRVFDRPAAGRAFFEGVIRDHLDVGRPDQVAILFDRRVSRRTPGTFRTKVITEGATLSSAATTVPAGSSSTGRRVAPCAPRRSSATRATLGSGDASAPRTGVPCGPLARPPTRVCVTRKPQMRVLLPTWSPSEW
jgi:hypothetical protein